MSINLVTIESFKREAKRLIKKFPSLREKIEDLGKSSKSTLKQVPLLEMAFTRSVWRSALKEKESGAAAG